MKMFQIYEATLILEALGNASTSANPNSSRFGRLVRLHYAKDGKIVNAEIKTYLLEKHRVAKGNANERNFHIFHYVSVINIIHSAIYNASVLRYSFCYIFFSSFIS